MTDDVINTMGLAPSSWHQLAHPGILHVNNKHHHHVEHHHHVDDHHDVDDHVDVDACMVMVM